MSTRTINLHNSRFSPHMDVSSERLLRVLDRLESEGMQVVRSTTPGGSTLAVIHWGPVSFEFIDPKPAAKPPVQCYPGVFYTDLSFRVTFPTLNSDELDTLPPRDRWIMIRREDYLMMHLERLLLEEEVLRIVPQSD